MKKKTSKERKVKTTDLSSEELIAIREMRQNAGWLAIEKVIKRNVKYLEHKILNDDDLSEEFKISARDLLRKWRDLNKRLLNLPEQLTESAEETEETNPLRLDPFARTIAEVREINERGRGIL